MEKNNNRKGRGSNRATDVNRRFYGDTATCATDKIMFAAQHGVLHREHTIADGDAICDHWIVGDRIKNPK